LEIASLFKINMNEKDENKKTCGCADETLAFLVLRLWLGVRATLAGIEKFGAYQAIKKPLIDPTTGQPDASGVLTGLMLLLGLGTRLSLFVQGLIYIALTVGLDFDQAGRRHFLAGHSHRAGRVRAGARKKQQICLLKKW
jgi:uncharacterized membrane protein YphA (DoxX/SURF4 family)